MFIVKDDVQILRQIIVHIIPLMAVPNIPRGNTNTENASLAVRIFECHHHYYIRLLTEIMRNNYWYVIKYISYLFKSALCTALLLRSLCKFLYMLLHHAASYVATWWGKTLNLFRTFCSVEYRFKKYFIIWAWNCRENYIRKSNIYPKAENRSFPGCQGNHCMQISVYWMFDCKRTKLLKGGKPLYLEW